MKVVTFSRDTVYNTVTEKLKIPAVSFIFSLTVFPEHNAVCVGSEDNAASLYIPHTALTMYPHPSQVCF